MSIGAGTRLGPYELVSPLGSGGMGEVYRARDTKLGREVAIKILPAAFRSDPDRLARFDREARSLASLNHPNIGAIYGVEEQSGVTALVLELVEGETLAERLGQGTRHKAQRSRLPLAEALTIARQIADALDAAHERGIVHRDLKPANIKITPAGIVKVLDFGLAKAVSHGGAAGLQAGLDLSHSPTMTSSGTETGVILGTAAYMSPEQARGSSVDKRADIWAFGCVLYEMFTDCTAFGGATVTDVLARILEREPDWTALPASTPPAITRLLRRCLEKDAKRRLRDIGDARQEVEESLIATSNDATSGPSPARTGREVEFQRLTDFVGMKESPAISPDGKMVAFVALVRGRRQIWIRLLAGGAPLQVTRDDVDHREPRWAPDSSTLIYYTRATTPGGQGTIWESSALGGPPRRVTSSIGGGDISHDGQKIAVFQPGADCIELLAVTRNGSRKECLARLPQEYRCSSPRWSPDGRSIAFQYQYSMTPFDMRLEVVSMDGGERREIAGHEWLRGFTWLRDSSGIVYSSSRGSTLLYPPIFNLRTVGRDGRRDSQLTFGDMSYAEPDLHHSGRLLAGRIKSQSDIWRFPIGGSAEENTRGAVRITRQTGQAQTPSVSPDGTELVYLSDNGGHGNLWVAQTDGMEVRQITFERDPTVILGVPMWSPAADWIVFIIVRSGQTGLWLIRPDGSDMHELVSAAWGASWSRDGRWLYHTKGDDGSARHEKIPVDGGTPVFVRDEQGNGTVAADERTIYYPVRLTSGLFGRWSGDAEIQGVRVEDGTAHPLARIDGSRVPISPPLLQMFLSPDNRWLATPLVDGATTNLWAVPTAGGPMRQLTDFGDRSILIGRSVSWSAEGDSLYAAVAETETDVVLFDGLIQ